MMGVDCRGVSILTARPESGSSAWARSSTAFEADATVRGDAAGALQ